LIDLKITLLENEREEVRIKRANVDEAVARFFFLFANFDHGDKCRTQTSDHQLVALESLKQMWIKINLDA